MLIKGSMVTEMSGSLGGITAARNRGGLYLRARSGSPNPNSPAQQDARTSFSALVTAWTSTLTETQREGWRDYAANVTVTNPLGDAHNLTGQQWYIGNNTPRIIAGLARVDDAPTTYATAQLNPVSLAVNEASLPPASLTFDDTQSWPDEDGSALLVQVSRPQNASITFFGGPFRFAGAVLGDSTTAPTSPAGFTNPFAVTEGQAVYARCRLTLADGRLSTPQIVRAVVAA